MCYTVFWQLTSHISAFKKFKPDAALYVVLSMMCHNIHTSARKDCMQHHPLLSTFAFALAVRLRLIALSLLGCRFGGGVLHILTRRGLRHNLLNIT